MPRYLIKRHIPGAGQMSAEQLQGAAQKSCAVLQHLGPDIQWVQSYVSDDAINCIYIAGNKQLIHDHAEQAGFPVNEIVEIVSVIDPTTAEA